MEVTTPLASLPYKEQIKKKQREVVQLLQQLEDVSPIVFPLLKIYFLETVVVDLHRFNADPDPAFILMPIRIRLSILMPIRFRLSILMPIRIRILSQVLHI
jgi:hypothetical protein